MLHWSGAPLSWLVGAAALAVTGLLTFRFPALFSGSHEFVSGTVSRATTVVLLMLLWAVFLLIVCGVLLLKGRRRRHVFGTLVLHIGVGLASPQLWHTLKEYQRLRVLTFLNPDRDPSGAGYQVIQSKIAIGSGALLGKGFLEGSQKGLAYLPEQHTDFAFSALGEEFGFVGTMIVTLLFLVVLLRGLRIAHLARDRFASFLAAGVVGLLTYHIVVNWFMTMGLAPVTGLPLPFISFGGSFLLVSMCFVGIIEGIAMRRHIL
jgi:rod shape determining protein RodA